MSDGSIRFSAVGDVTLGDHPLCAGFGAYSRFRKEERSFPFLGVRDVLRRSDVVFGNLECAHTDAGLRPWNLGSMQMRGAPEHVGALAEAGFTVVNVANNHTMQHGEESFLDSLRKLREAGISCCGVSADSGERKSLPVLVRRNGRTLGLLGYSLRPRQYFESVPLYAEGKPEGMIRDVTALRARADAVVVSVHWGEEFIQRPAPGEVRLARRLVDAGADLVLGHHPHVLRGVEQYGRGCIVYSLGNFICDMVWDESLRTGVIFQCSIGKEGVEKINLIPTYINDDFQAVVLGGERATDVLGHLDRLSAAIVGGEGDCEYLAGTNYLREADAFQRRVRAQSHRFFLSRIWRYPLPLLVQQFGRYLRNRASERLHAEQPSCGQGGGVPEREREGG